MWEVTSEVPREGGRKREVMRALPDSDASLTATVLPGWRRGRRTLRLPPRSRGGSEGLLERHVSLLSLRSFSISRFLLLGRAFGVWSAPSRGVDSAVTRVTQ